MQLMKAAPRNMSALKAVIVPAASVALFIARSLSLQAPCARVCVCGGGGDQQGAQAGA